MDNRQGKNIFIAAVALIVSCSSAWIFADESAQSRLVIPAAQAQFQDWLKKNGQRPVNFPGGKQYKSECALPSTRTTISKTTTTTTEEEPIVQTSPLSYKESQQLMLAQAPGGTPGPESNAAFNMMMKQNMPLAPQQVVKLRQMIDESQRASAIQPNVPPKPVSTTVMVNLSPGATPPAIRLSQGYVTSLVFVDSAGSPWPVGAYDLGDSKAININWDGKSNILLVVLSK